MSSRFPRLTLSASLLSATKQYARGLMSFYSGNRPNAPKEDVGIFPRPYYWWEAGAAWGAMIEYTQFTGDGSYVKDLQQALTSNYGPNNDFILSYRKDQTVREIPEAPRKPMLTVDSRATTTNVSGRSPP